MKNKSKMFGIAAIIVAIALLLAGCGNGTNGNGGGTTPTGGKTLTGIAVTAQPAKTVYAIGETLSTAGMVVTATYSDGSKEAVTGYTTSGFSSATAGPKTVTVTYQGMTAAFTVTVTDSSFLTLSGTIAISPVTATVNTELTATYSGSETVSYQWKKDGVNAGANANKYTPSEAGSYTVTVSAAGYNSKTSAAVTVTAISGLSGTIAISPASAVVGTELTATYSGSETVSYQWKKDGVNTGANANKYTPSETGSYTVTVSAAGYNSKTSAAVTVSPQPVSVPVSRIEYYWVNEKDSLVSTSGGTITIADDDTLTITAQGTGYTVKYWYLNGINTGQTGTTYNFSSPMTGKHNVGLFVEKDGKLYNANITITVTSQAYPFLLTADVWENGNLSAADSAVWYSFNVTEGTTYHVWWDSAYDDSTKAWIEVNAAYSNGTKIFTRETYAWFTAQSFTANQTGTVRLTIYPFNFNSGNTGTFAVVYSTNSTRP